MEVAIAVIGIVIALIALIVQVLDYRRKQNSEPVSVSESDSTVSRDESMTAEPRHLASLRQNLVQFFDVSELKNLCFDLNVDYESLPGDTKADKARELLKHMQRHGRLDELVAQCRQIRPQVRWLRTTAVSLVATSGSIPSVPQNLPRRSSFIGRGVEMAQVHAALASPDTYLVSIDGIGGIGKSSLALEVAYDCFESSSNDSASEEVARFAGYIWASAKDRELTLDLLLDEIAITLDYPGIVQQNLAQKQASIEKLLRSGAYLLIVDNFETVTDKALVKFVRDLPPPSRALITTREQNLQWARAISLKGLTQSEAFALIREEGKRFGIAGVHEADDSLLLPLYETTDGAPLAIRWAIGQIKQKGQTLEIVVLSLQQARSNIFEAIFSRSWQLLSSEARYVLMTMPFFAAPAHREALGAASNLQGFTLDDAIGQNVEMWLIEPTDAMGLHERRYRIHPLTRFFVSKKLNENPSVESEIWNQVAEYYQDFADRNGGFWNFDGFKRLELELQNVLKIVRMALERSCYDIGTPLFLQVSDYMIVRGHWNDAMEYSVELLQAAESTGNELYSARLKTWPIGWLHRHRGLLEVAKDETAQSIPVLDEFGDQRFAAYARRNLGRTYQELGEYEMAEKMLEEALDYYRSMDDQHHIYFVTTNLASLALERGELAEAWQRCSEILPGVYELGIPERIADALNVMGQVALLEGRQREAAELWEKALYYMEQARRLDEIAVGQLNLAKLHLDDDELGTARTLLDDALVTFRRLGMDNKVQEVESLIASISPDAQ